MPRDSPMPHEPTPRRRRTYRARDVRQGDIVLRKQWERWVFVGGLVAAAVLALLGHAAGLF